jgi:hypothetical protein
VSTFDTVIPWAWKRKESVHDFLFAYLQLFDE